MKEKLLVVLISVCVLAIVNLPIAYFYFARKDNFVFLGRRVVNSQDFYTYAAFVEQSRQGRNLFENLYTSEPQKPSLLRPSYLIIGRLAGLFRISSVIALHVSRVILSIILLFVLYRFIFKFFRDPNKRILAFLIVVVSNGFGTINWVPEAITFLALGEPPHFILSQIFILLGFYFFMEYLEKRDYKFIFVFSLIFFLLSLEHPFDIAVISPTIFFTSLWMGSSVFEAIFLALIVSFGLVYQVFEVFSNSVFKFWANQNVLMSPSLHDVVLGYGFLIPLSFVGVEKFFKKLTYERKLLLVWFFWGIVLIYSPFSFQRRMIEGLHVPMAILSVYGVFRFYRVVRHYKEFALACLLVILSAASLQYVYNDFAVISNQANHWYYFIDKDELAGIDFLGKHTNIGDVIFANKDYGNIIPGLIGRKVYIGHSVQTIDLDNKITAANSYLLDTNDFSSIDFLRRNKITYIFLGKNDSMIRYGFNPDERSYLSKIYSENGVGIYAFKERN